MDKARRENILRAYEGHLRRFNAGAGKRPRSAGLFLPSENAAVPRTEPGPVPQRRSNVLTVRQQEVLALVGDGLSNDEICAQLNITVETVKSHVQNILRGIGACNRAHAVTLGHRYGILPRSVAAHTPEYSTRSR